MTKKRNPPVILKTFTDGNVECILDEEHLGETVVYLSQAVCGAFDVAGEHENEVRDALSTMALQMASVVLGKEEPTGEKSMIQ